MVYFDSEFIAIFRWEPALVQMMAWRRSSNKAVSEPNTAKSTDAWLRYGIKALLALLPLCEGTVGHRWIPLTKGPVMQSFAVSILVSFSKMLNNSRIDGALRRHGTQVTSL